MADLYTECGHGRLYTQDCDLCEAVWLTSVTLPQIILLSKRAAHFALEHPGILERSLVESIAHLNHTISVLASEIEQLKVERKEGKHG